MKKQTGKLKTPEGPQRTKWGVRVYYDGKTEAYLRAEAKRRGFVNVQKMLEYDGRRAREAAEG